MPLSDLFSQTNRVSLARSSLKLTMPTLLEPTWFQFEGRALSPPDEPPRPGADASEVLHALGFDIEACQAMLAAGSIGRTDWSHLAST
jgi:hypothetical protein